MNDTSQPDLSIVIPCYNDGPYLIQALESIKLYKGTYKIEIIIVDDGSDHIETIEILKNLSDTSSLKIIKCKNNGLSFARNMGFAASTSPFIIPLDSDDIINHEILDSALNLIKSDDSLDIIYGDCEYFQEKTGVSIKKMDEFSQFYVNCLNATALIKKSTWERIGGYDESMKEGYEDWDLWLRMLSVGARFEKINSVFFKYRIKSNSMVKETIKKHDKISSYIQKKNIKYFNSQYIKLHRELKEIKNNRRLLVKFLIRNLLGKTN